MRKILLLVLAAIISVIMFSCSDETGPSAPYCQWDNYSAPIVDSQGGRIIYYDYGITDIVFHSSYDWIETIFSEERAGYWLYDYRTGDSEKLDLPYNYIPYAWNGDSLLLQNRDWLNWGTYIYSIESGSITPYFLQTDMGPVVLAYPGGQNKVLFAVENPTRDSVDFFILQDDSLISCPRAINARWAQNGVDLILIISRPENLTDSYVIGYYHSGTSMIDTIILPNEMRFPLNISVGTEYSYISANLTGDYWGCGIYRFSSFQNPVYEKITHGEISQQSTLGDTLFFIGYIEAEQGILSQIARIDPSGQITYYTDWNPEITITH